MCRTERVLACTMDLMEDTPLVRSIGRRIALPKWDIREQSITDTKSLAVQRNSRQFSW